MSGGGPEEGWNQLLRLGRWIQGGAESAWRSSGSGGGFLSLFLLPTGETRWGKDEGGATAEEEVGGPNEMAWWLDLAHGPCV